MVVLTDLQRVVEKVGQLAAAKVCRMAEKWVENWVEYWASYLALRLADLRVGRKACK